MLNQRARNLLWVFVERFSVVLISVFTFFFYAKLLGPKEFGAALFALSIGQGVGVLFFSFLEDPLVRQDNIAAVHYDSAFWGSLIASLVAVIGIMVSCVLASQDRRFLWLMLLSVTHIPLLCIGHIYVAELRRKGMYKALAKRTMGGKLMGGAVGLTLAWYGFGSFAIVAQSVIMALVSLIIMARTSSLRFGTQLQLPVLWQLLDVGWPLAVRNASWDTMNRGITVLLGVTSDNVAVGIFGLARRMIDMPRTAIYGGLLSYALPAFARNQNDLPNLRKMFQFSTLTTCFIVCPMFVGLALVAPYLIPPLFGDEWLPAIPLIQILALLTALNNTLTYISPALTAVAKNKLTLPSELFADFTALAVTAATGAPLGALAGACAQTLRLLIVFPPKIIAMQKALGIRPELWLAAIYKSLLASAGMAAAIYACILIFPMLHPLSLALLLIGVGMGVYLLIYTGLHRSWLTELKTFLVKT